MTLKKSFSSDHFVGASKPLSLSDDVVSTALYDGPGNCYRYCLKRTWDETRPLVMWLMMNPSIATEDGDDRTVAKCQRYSRAWGYGGMFVGNSFAYRCTDQKRLLEVSDPVGPLNDHYLVEMGKQAECVILAYGTPLSKTLHQRGTDVARLLANENITIKAMRLSKKSGRPEHPLYLPSALLPVTLDPALFF